MGARLIREKDAPRFEVHGAKVIGYASPSRGSASVSTWRVTLEGGMASPKHSLDSDEVFVCLGGAADFFIDADILRVSAGDAITVAAGTTFRFVVTSAEAFTAVATVLAGAKARVEGGEAFTPPWSA